MSTITKGSDLTWADWVANERCDSPTEHERELIERRSELVIFGYVCDAEVDHGYDDYALVRLGDRYYLLHTSGCSCPSPSETWGIDMGPCSLDDIERELRADEKDGKTYGVTARQFGEFLELVRVAREESTSP